MSDVNAAPNSDDEADRVNALLAGIDPAMIDGGEQIAEYLGHAMPSGTASDAERPRVEAARDRAEPAAAEPAAPKGPTNQPNAAATANSIGVAEDEPREREQGQHPGQAKDDEPADRDAPKRKPIFEKTGYELPKSVSALYVARDGKFVDRKSERIHFEDSGKKLSTTSEDRRVIESMIEVAKAKNWDRLELRGSEEFRRQAWIAAELAGIESHGYKPTAQDQAVLQARREEMRIAGGNKGAEAGKATENSISVDAPAREQDRESTREHDPDRLLSERQKFAIASLKAIYDGRGDPKEAVEKALDVARARFVDDRVHVGRVLQHGAAPYNHDPENASNYYVRLATTDGERTVWGVDLARSAEEGLLNPGEDVLLAYRGKQPVTVPTAELDAEGNKTGRMIEVTTHRNTWDVLEAGKLLELGQAREAAADNGTATTAANAKTITVDEEARLRAEWTPERMAALAAEIERDKAAEREREIKETIERFKDPEYRKRQARELLLRAGRDPEDFPEVFGKDEKGASDRPASPASAPAKDAEQRASEATPASAKEAALRAVLEHEMERKGLPEDERRVQRANLDAAIETARAAGQDLDVPEPLTVDRSAQAAQNQALQVEQTQGNPTIEINH